MFISDYMITNMGFVSVACASLDEPLPKSLGMSGELVAEFGSCAAILHVVSRRLLISESRVQSQARPLSDVSDSVNKSDILLMFQKLKNTSDAASLRSHNYERKSKYKVLCVGTS
jgi:hypothetical protein